ncbi:MAG: hypothetical protein JEZ09_09450 [Salinivirgaceae bacterium]|nr:hypothetical protein [Salinivirgaceae bacterium]
MIKFLKAFFLVGIIFFSTNTFGQYLPSSYESLFNEIVLNFEEIRGGNSLNDGKESLRLLDNEKIILRIEHKRKIKTLTFIKEADEEGSKFWVSGNKLTTDMVNKFEKDLTKSLENMLELSREEAKKD